MPYIGRMAGPDELLDGFAAVALGDPSPAGAARERVRLAVVNYGLAFYETDLGSGRVTLTANAFTIFGLPVPPVLVADRSPFWDCYHPDDIGWARERFKADLAGARDSYRERVRIIRRADGAVRWVEFAGTLFGPPGARTHNIGMLRDVTGEVEAASVRELLMREINHRAKNTMAIVQSLIRATRAATVADYKAALEARLLSLNRSQSLLLDPDRPVGVAELLEGELAPFAGRVRIEAAAEVPPLAPGAIQPVAMILHELATNAAKHGALAGAGTVAVRVAVDARAVTLDWREEGGAAPAAAPAAAGTGSRILAAQAGRLGAALRRDWRPGGLHVELLVPLRQWRAGG